MQSWMSGVRELTGYHLLPARPQQALPGAPYDRWISPDGAIAAEFHRDGEDLIVRFPHQADFRLSGSGGVSATPVTAAAAVESLYRNAILPMLGNHSGGLHLHGSAVATAANTGANMGAIAFLGLSRRGKTTLAGAFARAGHPFLTEDVLALDGDGQSYQVQPQQPVLRLFADSAGFLFGTGIGEGSAQEPPAKAEFAAGDLLPHARNPAPLRAIFVLGPGAVAATTITRLPPAAALAELIQHAFVLDVEDKPRLRAHFDRIATLAASVPCHALDYPRSYAHLPGVIADILAAVAVDNATCC